MGVISETVLNNFSERSRVAFFPSASVRVRVRLSPAGDRGRPGEKKWREFLRRLIVGFDQRRVMERWARRIGYRGGFGF
jgi:hypothetical protein